MATYTRLGAYLLSGELTSDPFGRIHRGVAIAGAAFERHLLVRSFSDELLHAGLAARLPDAARVASELGPAKGLATGLRIEGGAAPLVACDYVPGRSLAQMIEKARQEQIPFGVDHALSVVQGLALGIVHLHGRGLSHGLLSPHSVWIGFEGAAQIQDAAYAALVRPMLPKAPFLRASLEPYGREGAATPLHQDLYALGAILYELLTFERPPAGAGAAAALADLSLKAAQEDAPVPAELSALLRRLLLAGPPFESLEAFNGELERVLYDGEYSPTTFNMAFFMHTLFREENDRDGQAMKGDQTEDFSPYLSAVEAAKQRPLAMESGVQAGAAGGPSSSMLKIGLGAAAAVAVLLGAGGLYIRNQHKENERLQSQLSGLQREQAVAQQNAADLANQEVQAQKEKEGVAKKLADAKSTTEKEQLRKQQAELEKRTEDLRQQRLEEERKAADSRARAQQLTASAAPRQAPPAPAPAPAPTPVAAPPAAPAVAVQPPPAAAPAPTPAPPVATPAPAPAPSVATVEEPPRMVSQVAPTIPARARTPSNPNRLRDLQVGVRVTIDPRGNPTKAIITEGVDGPWGYNEAAVEAAMACSYGAATRDGRPVSGTMTVVFKFPKSR